MKLRRVLGATGALLVAAFLACTSREADVGGVMFEIANDGTLTIDLLHVEITNGDTNKIVVLRDFRIPQEATLPSTIGIASNGDPRATAVIKMSAYHLEGDRRVPLDRRDHVVTQVPVDRVVAVPIVLSAACSAWVKSDPTSGDAVSTCEDGMTCSPSSGSCVTRIIDAASLRTYSPGDEDRITLPAKEGGTCGPSQKSCGGTCVDQDDARYGCTLSSCEPCAGDPLTTYTCEGGACKAGGCVAASKDCAGQCVLADAAHGCSASSCEPCKGSPVGAATCDLAGRCSLGCNTGYKLCGGACVSISDPTYGCGATTCDSSSCPTAGGGTLVCNGATCELGTCGANTKNCDSICVPTDVTRGCAELTRCTACANNESCVGSPSTCQCVPEAKSKTCTAPACGIVKNNCNEDVDCGSCSCPGPSSQGCGNCGTQTRTCNNGTWSAWSTCTGEGECTPSTTQACGQSMSKTCDGACHWGTCGCSLGDSLNCGSCGHSCLGGACSNGFCTPVPLAPAPNATRLAIDDTHIYWTDFNGGKVMACAVGGCAQSPTTIASGLISPFGIAVDGTNVYFTEDYSAGTIRVCPRTGCPGTPATLATNLSYPSSLVLAGGEFFFNWGFKIAHCSVSGCPATPPTFAVASEIDWIAAGAGQIYWSNDNEAKVGSCPVSGCPDAGSMTVASGQAAPYAIFGTSTEVFWSNAATNNNDGQIMKCAATNCVTPTPLAVNQPFPGELAVDAVNVYWANRTTGTIVKCARTGCGGAPTTLAFNQNPQSLVADANFLYWVSSGTIMKMAK